jgi:cytochrome c oxidase cbb3-type subunit 4
MLHEEVEQMISGIVTAILLVVFVGGWVWAWSPRRRREFEEAALLPLDESNLDEKRVDGMQKETRP